MALMVRCIPVMFGDHKYPGSGGVFLICHMVLQDHMMKGSRPLWVGVAHSMSQSYHIWWPLALS